MLSSPQPTSNDLSATAQQACEAYKQLPLALPRAMRIYTAMRRAQLRLDSRGMLALQHICEAHGKCYVLRNPPYNSSVSQSAEAHGLLPVCADSE